MEVTTIREYSSPRSFHFSEVYWGSSVLVLHSSGGAYLGDAIDLMFLSTDYLNLPFEIRGLSVSQPCGESEIEFEKEFGIARRLEEPKGKRVFLIESSKRFQVIGKDVGGGSNSSTRTFITTLVAFAQKETETGVEPVRDINLLRRNLRAEKKQQTR